MYNRGHTILIANIEHCFYLKCSEVKFSCSIFCLLQIEIENGNEKLLFVFVVHSGIFGAGR